MFTICPEHSKTRVRRAGEAVREGRFTPEDEAVIENWRASHNYILNTFQATLRRHARDREVIVAQRLKRRTTIYDKLRRENGMQLPRMHDIAGCRLIFENEAALRDMRAQILASRFKHVRRNAINAYDYIRNPKERGYRGIHDVYGYKSYNGQADAWNGLLIELQYRTKHQHSWATAVEIFGAITGAEAKFNRAAQGQLDFFRLTSEIIARYHEGRLGPLPMLSNDELFQRFRAVDTEIRGMELLQGLHASGAEMKNVRNIILATPPGGTLQIYGYSESRSALEQYFYLETEHSDWDVVLVRADSNEGIRNAFKNYFSDAREFTAYIRSAMKDRPFTRRSRPTYIEIDTALPKF